MQSISVNSEISGLRIDKFLCKKFDIAFAVAQKLLREGKVKINNCKTSPSYKILPNDLIHISANLTNRTSVAQFKPIISSKKSQNFWKNIVFEDENLLAINKPSGLASQGGSGIDISVADFAKLKNYQLVHRLDKDTSGLLLLAKNSKTADLLTEKFKTKEIHKTYLALVCGVVRKERIIIKIPLAKKLLGKNEKVMPDYENGKPAITELKTIRVQKKFSLVELSPITGRTHQLRVHCKEIGHPIVNDVKYGGLASLVFKNESGALLQGAEGLKTQEEFDKLSKTAIKSTNLCLANRQKNEIITEMRRRLCLHAQAICIDNYFGKKLLIETKKPIFAKIGEVKIV